MFDVQLFLGFQTTPQFDACVQKNNSHLVSLLTGGGDYLTPLEHRKKNYLGKYLSIPSAFDEILSMETHLLSLLRKIAPLFPFSSNSLLIFSVYGK